MWNQRYRRYKTSQPNLIITAVQAFPNINDTLEKVLKYYHIERLKADPLYKLIYSDYAFNSGNDFIPVAFENDCPKLKILSEKADLGKGWFWCIGMLPDGLEDKENYLNKFHRRSYTLPTFEVYSEWLPYYLEKYYNGRGDSIARHLLETMTIKYIYEAAPELTEKEKYRLFHIVQNRELNFEFHTNDLKDFLNFVKQFNELNWYELIFKAYK